jgi:hypothetical protein
MRGSGAEAAAPVSPSIIEVSDLKATCRALGLAPPPDGVNTIEVELLPGCVAAFTEVENSATDFIYLCTANLAEARHHIDSKFGMAQSGPDTVDPESLRIRGCVLRLGDMVIDAVHCPRAESQGVPCQDECHPSLSFE